MDRTIKENKMKKIVRYILVLAIILIALKVWAIIIEWEHPLPLMNDNGWGRLEWIVISIWEGLK